MTHEVTNSGSDRAQLTNMAKQAKAVLKTETLEAVADRGYFNSPEILACHEAGILRICQGRTPIAVQLGSDCRIATQTKKTARCCGVTGPQSVKIVRSNRDVRPGQSGGLRDGSMSICSRRCSSDSMQTHRPCDSVARTVEHPFGTMKARMGATHFLTKTLPKVAAEMALSVLAYNLTRVLNIVGSKQLMAAIVA